MALTESDLPTLTLLSKGKVRDIYATSDPDALLFVATDRISAYDVILKNGIPGKGALLTEISRFWFGKLGHIIPNHFITADIDTMPAEIHEYKEQIAARAMLVRKAQVVPLEAIVRGYLTGSAWAEYQKSGTVHGIALPAGLRESERFPTPLFTPSTKAELGAHDENISPEQAAELVGDAVYAQISAAAIALYTAASEHAHTRGLILADTKFEFGLVPAAVSTDSASTSTQQLLLIDELLTPDSSRYWPAAEYEPGRAQPSFDKQYLRDWLVGAGFRKGLEAGPEDAEGESGNAGWVIEASVVEGTRKRYEEVVAMLTAE
ncbi:phosphoribosylaminoimidazole-succinocarboxamide synthase [Mycena capillaripes]|nr:phosphoribosylaminoimidazole-succinocarboxamide synthase [Mycena capillaripes]